MKRRTFLKGLGACLGLMYTNPIALIPDIGGNHLVHPSVVAKEALWALEDNLCFSLDSFSKKFIEPATIKLAESVDKEMIIQFKRRV